jgi:ribonuclease-3
LTNWRSSLVRTESISAAAARYEFEPLLRLSRGEKRGTPRARAQILANCYEAVVGALYLDQGYDAAKKFIEKSLLVTFDEILKSGSWMDPKSHLQELVQSKEGFTPVYRVLSEEGPDHEKTFTVGVFVDGKVKGKGVGPSKQAGQVSAAEAALIKYKA